MAPYIYGARNGIHIIDIVQTLTLLEEVCNYLTKETKKGKTILFVGTKRQAAPAIQAAALEADCHYVNKRWLGGMLTNFSTMLTCIEKLRKMEQAQESMLLETEGTNKLKKKEVTRMKKEQAKLEKFFGGMKQMNKLPDIVIIVGQPREISAIRECEKLGISTITILDTNCNPDLADYFIPANDDSIRSVELILKEFTEAIKKGKQAA
jgi:small subunit ribosomal protein S2